MCRSEISASSVFAACMTDTDWSFSLRSATGFYNGSDSDDDNEENLGGARPPSRLSSSSSQILQQIDLAAREDSAQYKPNPWSIARVNAASRPQQPNATVTSVSGKPVVKKPPRGAIVDAFKRQVQKPKATTDSSAQANLLQTPSQNRALTPVIGAPDNSVPASACSSTPTTHIFTSVAHSVPLPQQLPILQHEQSPSLPSFLPTRASPASHPGRLISRLPNPRFTPNPTRALPFSSPGPLPPHPEHSVPSAPIPHTTPPQPQAQFPSHIFEPRTAPGTAHPVTSRGAPAASADQKGGSSVQHSTSRPHPTPVKLRRKTASSYSFQNNQRPPRLQSNQAIMKASPKSEQIPPSPSFVQARRFFEHGPPPPPAIKLPSPQPMFLDEELHPNLPPPPHRITSPPRRRTDPYDQLPPSPDSEWSTLKPPTRKVNGKTKPKVSGVKSGKFRLPLSFGTATPKEPPQKKARVITYLPPPPSKKRKVLEEPHPRTPDAESDICIGPCHSSVLIFFPLTPLPPFFSVPESESAGERVTLLATFR